MGNIFSGLESLGLKGADHVEIYAQDEVQKKANQEEKREEVIKESDFLFDKTYTCPACDTEFKVKSVRGGKVHLLGADSDLKPIYKEIDSLKYDAVMCPKCGYSALSSNFDFLMPRQIKNIQEKISANFVKPEEPEDEYSYDDAILRHKMALLCTVVKQGKNSEKAYTCLKLAWLVRDKRNELKKSGQLPEKDKISLMKEERDLLENAYDGFEAAYSKEDFPMCGMDRFTLDLLMGEVAYRIGKFQKASRHVNQLLGDRATPSRVKDKALDLKESIQKHIQK